MALIAADVRGHQPVHPATEIAVGRGPGGNDWASGSRPAPALAPAGCFRQQIDEGLVVVVLVEYVGSVIAPVQDMVTIVGSRGSCGAGRLRLRDGGVQNHELFYLFYQNLALAHHVPFFPPEIPSVTRKRAVLNHAGFGSPAATQRRQAIALAENRSSREFVSITRPSNWSAS